MSTFASIVTVGSTYAIYWVWLWPTAPGSPGITAWKDDFYTTCSDIDIVSETLPKTLNPLPQQDP
jgi:hypothetical protein